MDIDWTPTPRYLLRKSLVMRLLSQAGLQDKKLFEIGYGAGDILVSTAAQGAVVEGFDFSALARGHAEAYIVRRPEVRNKISLLDEMPLHGAAYEYLLAFEVLEHIQDDGAALQDWRKLLKPSGALVMSVPARMKKWGYSDIAAGHYRRYEKEALRALLEENGFAVEFLYSYGFPLTIPLDILQNLSYRKDALVKSSNHLSREECTKTSGVHRKHKLLMRLAVLPLFLYPFKLMQNLFLESDLGSGYIVFARRKEV